MGYLRPWCVGLCALLWAVIASAQSVPPTTSISINGTPRAVTQVIKAYFEQRELICAKSTPAYRREVLETAREALDALGYFAAQAQFNRPMPERCNLEVALGQRAQLSAWQVTFSGEVAAATEAAAQRLLPGLPTPFDPQAYNAVKQSFLVTLTDAGYIDAVFGRAEVDVDLADNRAAVDWVVDPGERYVIAPLTIDQSVLSDDLMRKFLEFVEGDYLVDAGVLQTYDNLISSDYFGSVRVSPALDQRADGKVPVRITATPANQWSYLAGPGFATDSGPRLRAEADARYLNKKGHRVGFSSLLSPVSGNVKSEYRWPYGNPTHEWYAADVRYSYEDTETANSDTVGIGLRRSSRLSRHWTQTSYLDYRVEDFDVSNQEGRSHLLLLGGNLGFTSSIDAPRPRGGRRLSIDIRGGSKALVSDIDVLQVRLSAKQILPFIGRSRVLLRAEAGFSWQQDFAELPASLRFFAGGDRSVRGYALESLGEEDDTGRVIGGDRLYVGSVEVDTPLSDRWSLALFTDVGSAFLDKPNFSQSVGLGVRWFSPLGPIRVDLAHPMQDSDQVVRLHISLGPDI